MTIELKEAIEKNPTLANFFTKEQLKDILINKTPEGYTWHHNQIPGKMQLFDVEKHKQLWHTGGRAIWGSGSEKR